MVDTAAILAAPEGKSKGRKLWRTPALEGDVLADGNASSALDFILLAPGPTEHRSLRFYA